MSDIWWSLPLSVGAFMLARRLAAKLKISLLNPLLVAMAIIIPLLLVLQIPYARYFAGSQILNQLLQPAVVALALPLYEPEDQLATASYVHGYGFRSYKQMPESVYDVWLSEH